MPPIFSSTQAFLTFLVQVLLLIVALFAAWMFSRYLRSALAQNRLSAIRRLAEVAVDYVEHLDGRGELSAPVRTDRAARKRELAAQWLVGRLKDDGVRISTEQAQTWIAAEMHRRVGSLLPVEKVAELARTSVELAQRLEQAHLVATPANVNASAYLAGLSADWLAVEAAKLGVNLQREQALAYVRGATLEKLVARANQVTIEDPLTRLAWEAVEYMENLKASGKQTIRPGAGGGNLEMDITTAWMITEVTRRGLAVTADQISDALEAELAQRPERITNALTAGE